MVPQQQECNNSARVIAKVNDISSYWNFQLPTEYVTIGKAISSQVGYWWAAISCLKRTHSIKLQGVRGQTFTFQFALTDRNIQATFGLRVVWESWVVEIWPMTLQFC